MISEVKKICFIGAGTQGCLNSLICSSFGYNSVLFDISEKMLNQVTRRQQYIGAGFIKQGYFDFKTFEKTFSRIKIESDIEKAVESSDLVSESVHERVKLKRKVHRQLDDICPVKTILTTNTSSLLLSDIESAVQRGDKFAALHFNGLKPLIDIVGGPRTSIETIDILERFVESLKSRPMVLKKEKGGYLSNSMIISYVKTALLLVINHYAEMEDVDRSWMITHNASFGPFGQMDGIGLNVTLDVFEEEAAKNLENSGDTKKVVNYIRPYVERGELGVKTGKGFYTYPNPSFQNPDFLMGG